MKKGVTITLLLTLSFILLAIIFVVPKDQGSLLASESANLNLPLIMKNNPERDALMALYSGTNGPGWRKNTGWGDGDPCEHDWFGVQCHSGHVRILDLSNNKLNGSIPPELGNLSRLEYLYLTDNQLKGSIPPNLGNLSR